MRASCTRPTRVADSETHARQCSFAHPGAPIMSTHEFLTYQETVDMLGAPETVRQAVLTWDLPAYVELNEAPAHAASITDGEALPPSNGTKYAKWRRLSRWHCVADPDIEYPDDDDYEEEVYYTLFGWFVMRPPDACIIARSPGRDVKLTLYVAPAQSDDDGSAGLLTLEHFDVDYVAGLEKLWFRRASVENLLSTANSKDNVGEGNKSLSDASEPKAFTYLSIIQAQAAAAKVSLPDATPRVIKALEDIKFTNYDGEAIVRLLDAVSKFTKDTYETAKINGERTYQFDRATYQAAILALASLAKLPLRRRAGPALKEKLRRVGFKGYVPSPGTLEKVFNEVRSIAPRALLRP